MLCYGLAIIIFLVTISNVIGQQKSKSMFDTKESPLFTIRNLNIMNKKNHNLTSEYIGSNLKDSIPLQSISKRYEFFHDALQIIKSQNIDDFNYLSSLYQNLLRNGIVNDELQKISNQVLFSEINIDFLINHQDFSKLIDYPVRLLNWENQSIPASGILLIFLVFLLAFGFFIFGFLISVNMPNECIPVTFGCSETYDYCQIKQILSR